MGQVISLENQRPTVLLSKLIQWFLFVGNAGGRGKRPLPGENMWNALPSANTQRAHAYVSTQTALLESKREITGMSEVWGPCLHFAVTGAGCLCHT